MISSRCVEFADYRGLVDLERGDVSLSRAVNR